jgi:hypothetical protein
MKRNESARGINQLSTLNEKDGFERSEMICAKNMKTQFQKLPTTFYQVIVTRSETLKMLSLW